MKVEVLTKESWAETGAAFFILVGFFLSLLLRNAATAYLIILLSGFLAGRILYIRRHKEPIFPFILIILGFLFGYVLGSFWVSRFWVVGLFLAGLGASYWLHKKEVLVIFRKEEFIR